MSYPLPSHVLSFPIFLSLHYISESKEAKIAAKYRSLIYHPFVDHIRVMRYNWDPLAEPEVPTSLTAVSWMDGANGQLKKITCEKNLETESKRKIVCCKHSASQTAVKQAADTGPMFKWMKVLLREMDSPNSTINHIHHFIDKELSKLQDEGILNLSSHKKKAILSTIPKLPSVTGKSHHISNIRKGFILNGQLDIDSKLVPSLSNMLHTFQGDIRGTCLENKDWLVSKFYAEMYSNGVIAEQTYNTLFVPKDRDMNGIPVLRDFAITQENRQQAKILLSPKQIEEWKIVLYQKKLICYLKMKQLYDTETQDYVLNKRCENKLMDIVATYRRQLAHSSLATTTVNPLPVMMNVSFKETCTGITLDLVLANKSTILLPEAQAFVKVRCDRVVVRGRRVFRNIPQLKNDILAKVVVMVEVVVKPRHHPLPVEPVMPTNRSHGSHGSEATAVRDGRSDGDNDSMSIDGDDLHSVSIDE